MAEGKGKIERREFERVAMRMFVMYEPVPDDQADRLIAKKEYKDISMGAQSKGAVRDMMTVVTENISMGGMCLIGDKPFKEGQTLRVSIRFPQSSNPVQALATVVRLVQPREPDLFGAGVRFVGLNRADIAVLEKAVAGARKPAT